MHNAGVARVVHSEKEEQVVPQIEDDAGNDADAKGVPANLHSIQYHLAQHPGSCHPARVKCLAGRSMGWASQGRTKGRRWRSLP